MRLLRQLFVLLLLIAGAFDGGARGRMPDDLGGPDAGNATARTDARTRGCPQDALAGETVADGECDGADGEEARLDEGPTAVVLQAPIARAERCGAPSWTRVCERRALPHGWTRGFERPPRS